MKIELLDAAEQDLLWGFAFYEKQERGLGSYFLDALCSDTKMTRFAERFIEEGIGQGEARVLLRQLTLQFGPLPEPVRARIESADADTLLRWSGRVLIADQLDEVFGA